MKIAMLAPIAWRTPPVHYGPWELVASLLTEELVRRGIDLEQFTFRREPAGGYLLYYGRIHPDKGTKEAIEIALQAGRRLVIAGIVQDKGYFDRYVRPYLKEKKIDYIGSVGQDKRDRLLGEAAALLHPIRFSEPFGLSAVEAMACGTPVLAFRKGSMPELIDDGRNGFLVENTAEAVEKVSRLNQIDRAACRQTVEKRFTLSFAGS